MPAHIVITGAAGFLGSALAGQALRAGFSVTATDRIASVKFSGLNVIPADILDLPSLKRVFRDADCVCHAAGLAHIFDKSELPGAPFHAVNVEGAENAARAAHGAGVRHFILASSVSVYGRFAPGKDENSPCHPEGPYAESKWLAEKRLTEFCQKEGMDLTILRLATLYGEGDPGNVARLMRMIDRGRFVWIGNGSNRKSLLHREDAARACLAVVQKPSAGVRVFNVSAPPCAMRDVVEGLAAALGKRVPWLGVPASLAQGVSGFLSRLPVKRWQTLGATVQKWLADDVVDGSQFEKTYDFQPRINLAEGLRREVAWYRGEQAKRGT